MAHYLLFRQMSKMQSSFILLKTKGSASPELVINLELNEMLSLIRFLVYAVCEWPSKLILLTASQLELSDAFGMGTTSRVPLPGVSLGKVFFKLTLKQYGIFTAAL